MNRTNLFVLTILLISQLRSWESYVILEKTGDILLSLLEHKQLDNNVLNTESTYSAKVSESRTSNESQTLLKQNQVSAKKVNQKQKSCYFCNSEKTQITLIEEQYKQRLEYIKQQILFKLGMNKAPKVDNRNIDTSAYMHLLEESSLAIAPTPPTEITTKPISEDSDKLFIFPRAKRLNTPAFNLSIAKNSFVANSIKKITLFVRQQSSASYFDDNSIDNEITLISAAVPINGVLTPYEDITNMRVLGIVSPQTSNGKSNSNDRHSFPNWLQYDVTQLLKPEITKRNKLVSFDSEGFDINNSFITVEHNSNNINRIKRSVDCNGNSSSCCRESFYVNFTTIGWDNWILQPVGYNANYCKGKCDISHARYHHTTVIGKYPAISLCCSPREMSHISLIYVDDNGLVFQKNLPNMVVESCDCA